MYRTDRENDSKRGGVLIYLREELDVGVETIAEGSAGNVEFLVLNVTVLNLIIVNIYRPPLTQNIHFEKVLKTIQEVLSLSAGMSIVLTGDLNLPIIDWTHLSIYGGTSADRDQGKLLLRLFEENFLEQLILKPTRGDNILDLFATNDHELAWRITVEDTKISDHKILTIFTSFDNATVTQRDTNVGAPLDKLNFWHEKIDWASIKHELAEIDWRHELLNKDVDQIYDTILNLITPVCYRSVPLKTCKPRAQIPRDRRVLMRNRSNIRKKLENEVSQRKLFEHRKKIGDIENKLIASHIAEIQRQEEHAINCIKENPKFFFKFARNKSHVKSPVGPLMDEHGKISSNSQQMCEILETQFETVYSSPMNPENIEAILSLPGPRCLETIEFTEDDILQSIMETRKTASPGPDGVSAFF